MVMVAVEDFDIDARLGHSVREQAELSGHVLLEALHEHLPFTEHADACRFERLASGGAVRE